MQQLSVVGRLFPSIERGEKTSTIRWREPVIDVGPMRYVHGDDPTRTVVVDVVRVTSMPLRDAAGFVGRVDDWPDTAMLDSMREHYPTIELDDVVEVIEHMPATNRSDAGV